MAETWKNFLFEVEVLLLYWNDNIWFWFFSFFFHFPLFSHAVPLQILATWIGFLMLKPFRKHLCFQFNLRNQ